MGGSPVFQRSGSGRYSANNSYNYGQTPSPAAYQQESNAVVSSTTQGGADVIESCENGSGQSKWIQIR